MEPTAEATDENLLRKMWAGDEDAFTALYRRHQGAVYRFALRMSGKSAVAEEVTQEVFLRLMDERGYDTARGSLPSFLYGMARNYVLRALGQERRYSASLDDAETSDVVCPDESVLGNLSRGQQIERMKQAVLGLPAPYREVVVLCELEELEYSAAAQVLDCPVGTVRSRLHRARALLARKLGLPERCTV